MENNNLLIHELAIKAGVTVRTIRYYIGEGILPSGDKQGKYALYNQEHLDRLELISRLKEIYLPLDKIKLFMSSTPLDEIRFLLEKPVEELTLFFRRSIPQEATPKKPTKPLPHPHKLQDAPAAHQKPLFEAPNSYQEWRKYELLDGVELHIRLPINAHKAKLMIKIQELVSQSKDKKPSTWQKE